MGKSYKKNEYQSESLGVEYVSKARFYRAVKGRKPVEEEDVEDDIDSGLREYRERNQDSNENL